MFLIKDKTGGRNIKVKMSLSEDKLIYIGVGLAAMGMIIYCFYMIGEEDEY